MDPSLCFALWTVNSSFSTPLRLRRSTGSVTTLPGAGRGQVSGAPLRSRAAADCAKPRHNDTSKRRFVNVSRGPRFAPIQIFSAPNLRLAAIRQAGISVLEFKNGIPLYTEFACAQGVK